MPLDKCIQLDTMMVTSKEQNEMNSNFTLNGKTYTTDSETLNVLRSIMQDAKDSGDSTAVQAVIFLGLETGRIVEAGE